MFQSLQRHATGHSSCCSAAAGAAAPLVSPLLPHRRSSRSRTLACRAVERDPQQQQQPPEPPADPLQQQRPAAASADDLQRALKRAVAAEDYSEAARLKQQLDEVLAQDPLVVLQRQLQAAVDEERYQDAARLRDQLRELQEKLGPPPTAEVGAVPTTSDTVTNGVRVRVQRCAFGCFLVIFGVAWGFGCVSLLWWHAGVAHSD